MNVTYSFGEELAGSGIGRIAGHAVAGAQRAGLLDRVVAIDASDAAIPPEKLRQVPLGGLLNRCPNYYLKDTTYDLVATRMLGSPDLFHGWNNMCLRSLRRAGQRGASTVVERASTHPTVQREMVEREYETHWDGRSFNSDRLLRRSLAELRECDAVFVPSEFVYDSFADVGIDQSKLVTIPFGVDTGQFSPPEKFARRGEPFRALFAGQVSLRKGIQYLLPAWQRADVDGTLRIAGEVTPSARGVVADYRDDPSIEFLGWVDDMPAEYRRASVFAFPSVEEGSALVSYEAMASGLPSVVTPNVGSLVEDGEHGVVVEPRDVDAVAAALERLAGDPEERSAMGRAARETVESYTWAAYGDRVAEAYRELL